MAKGDLKRKSKFGGDYKIRRSQRGRLRKAGIKLKPGVDPNDERVKKGCTSKHKYDTKALASAAAARCAKRLGLVHSYYHCGACGFHHVFRVKEGGEYVKLEPRNLVPSVIPLR